jgi:hypothetical protein
MNGTFTSPVTPEIVRTVVGVTGTFRSARVAGSKVIPASRSTLVNEGSPARATSRPG